MNRVSMKYQWHVCFYALFVLLFSSYGVAQAQPQVEIQVNLTAETTDDYVTWAPTWCRIRVVDSQGADGLIAVTLRNEDSNQGGQLLFDHVISPWPAGRTARESSLDLSLSSNGDWVEFIIAGRFGYPSVRDKDAVIAAYEANGGGQIGRHELMVRVRKDASTLTQEERDRYLNAIMQLNESGAYNIFARTHLFGMVEAHHGPAFLPWHRAYILNYERALQAIDPSVALHYWRFNRPAPDVFTPDFMGYRAPGDRSGYATFAETNPLMDWSVWGPDQETEVGIYRGNVGGWVDQTGLPDMRFGPTPGQINSTPEALAEELEISLCELLFFLDDDAFRTEEETIATSDFVEFTMDLEGNPHGFAHDWVGALGGWMGNLRTAAQDPMFFLLHSNVDRLWATWQRRHDRFGSGELDYFPLGSFDENRIEDRAIRKGHYLLDEMWPWNGVTGTYDPIPPDDGEEEEPFDCDDQNDHGEMDPDDEPIEIDVEELMNRPYETPELPSYSFDRMGTITTPRPIDMIDYLGRTEPALDLGFSYDNVPYEVEVGTSNVGDQWTLFR